MNAYVFAAGAQLGRLIALLRPTYSWIWGRKYGRENGKGLGTKGEEKEGNGEGNVDGGLSSYLNVK